MHGSPQRITLALFTSFINSFRTVYVRYRSAQQIGSKLIAAL